MLRGIQAALGQRVQWNQVSLIKAVVMPIEFQFGTGDQRDGVQIADIGVLQGIASALISVGIQPQPGQFLQVAQRRQHHHAERGETLLPIDDVEALAVRGLQDQITHVVGRLGFLVEQAENVLPQVIPLVVRPGIIPLKGRHLIAQAIAQQLAKRLVGGIEVHGGQGQSSIASRPAIFFRAAPNLGEFAFTTSSKSITNCSVASRESMSF